MTDVQALSTLTVHDGVAVLTIDSPPVNALGLAVRRALHAGLSAAIADPAAASVVVRCAGRTFFAGADITEFGKPIQAPDLNMVFDIIEASPKPVVAAIHGTALGGGFELALACHYRVAVSSAKVGLPEVSLGLLPGAGGTQRTPRIAGVAMALDLIVSGRPLDATAAKAAGLVDAIIQGELEAGAIAFARDAARRPGPPPRIRDLQPDLDAVQAAAAITDFRARNARAFKGFKAPGNIVLAIEAATVLPFDQGLAREAELFEQLMASRESAAQRHVFFAERAAGKVPGLKAGDVAAPIASVAVIGAGTMGGGIATAFLNIDLPVLLIDRDAAAVARGAANIAKTLQAAIDKGRLDPGRGAARIARLTTSMELSDAAQADLVVEAVYENLELKKDIFRQLDQVAKPGAILASNTSFLDLDAIAAVTSRPDQVVGLHFFAPANIMRLLEVVRGAATAGPVLASAMALGRRLGKVAVLSGVCDGFIANRMMARRGEAADRLLLEGPSPSRIDQVMADYGFPMGPFAMMDLVGLDVIGWDREASAGRTVQEVFCEAGRWGQKTGGGYFDYDAARRAASSPVADQMIRDFVARTRGATRDYVDAEIVERLLYPVVNEGARILEEGVALRASDIDIALVTGYGWPAFTGGPMFWADGVGLARIVDSLERALGRDAVSPLLRALATDGGSLADQ